MEYKRFLKAKGTIMVLTLVLSAIAFLPVVSSLSTEGEARVWGFVFDNYDNAIEDVHVTITDLHTGESETSTFSDGLFNFDGLTDGYYSLKAHASGYMEDGDGYKEVKIVNGKVVQVDGQSVSTTQVNLALVKIQKNVEFGGTIINNETGIGMNKVNVTLYSLDGKYAGQEFTVFTSGTGNDTGTFTMDVPAGEYLLLITKGGYYYYNYSGDMTLDITTDMTDVEYQLYGINETSSEGSISFYCVDEDTGEPISDANAILTHLESGKTFRVTGSSLFVRMKAFFGNFTLLVDKDGYLPSYKYYTSSFELNASSPKFVNKPLVLTKDRNETMTTSVTFQDWNRVTVMSDWQLSSGTNLAGLQGSELGTLAHRIETDNRFGNGDATLNGTEVAAFRSWLTDRGPFYFDTEGFISINETYFKGANLKSGANFSVDLTNFSGNTYDEKYLEMSQTMDYISSEEIDKDIFYVTVDGSIREKETVEVIFPDGYEIISTGLEGVEVTDINRALVTSRVTLIVDKAESPSANISATLGGELFYGGDTIDVGLVGDGVEYYNRNGFDMENISFDASGSSDPNGNINDANFTWVFGDGEKAYGMNVTHNYTKARDYTVQLTIRDPSNRTAKANLAVHVDNTPPTADFELEGNVGTTVNQNQKVTLNASASEDDSGIPDFDESYKWEFKRGDSDDIDVATGRVTEKTFKSPGTWNITLTVRDKVGLTQSQYKTITVRDTEAPTLQIVGPNEANYREEVTFNASGSTDNFDDELSYQWDFDESDGISQDATGPVVSHSYEFPGVYVVTLTATDDAGNSNNKTHEVDIRGPEMSILFLNLSDTKVVEDENIEIEVVVSNTGSVLVENVTLRVTVEFNAAKINTVGTSKLNIPVGDSVKRTFNWSAKPGEDIIVRAVLDPDNVTGIGEDERVTWTEDATIKLVEEESAPWAIIIIIAVIVVVIAGFLYYYYRREGSFEGLMFWKK